MKENKEVKRQMLKQMVSDIKHNGMCYLKSEVAAKQLREFNPNVEVKYNKRENCYMATYKYNGE